MIAAGPSAALLGLCATLSIACAAPPSADAATMPFASNGAEQVFTVPAGVSSVHVVAIGAPGGASGSRSGGFGGRVVGDLPVVGGQTLFVEVGGRGNRPSDTPSGAGGFNGGASGGTGGGGYHVSGGGGASDVRTVSAAQGGSLGSRLIVAGGGGGAGDFYGLNSGGDAGSPGGNGGNAPDASSGGGGGGGAGTVGGPGAGGSGAGGAAGAPGILGVGGTGGNSTGFGGGGGGGGRYGGGGGGGADPNGSGGGGGGSSFTDPVVGNASIATDATGVPSIAISYQEPGGGGTPPPPTVVRPVLTGVSQSASKWRKGSLLPKISRKKKPPVGTTFSFALNKAATVRLAFTQRVGGRKVKGKCVAPTKRNKKKPKCTRTITVGTLTFQGRAGTNKIRFQGRLSSRKSLKPGRYTLTITARDSAGLQSTPRSLSFTIVKG